MYCRYCGAELPEDSAFCNKCGKATGAVRHASPSEQAHRMRSDERPYRPSRIAPPNRVPAAERPTRDHGADTWWKVLAGTGIGMFLANLFGSHASADEHTTGYGYNETSAGAIDAEQSDAPYDDAQNDGSYDDAQSDETYDDTEDYYDGEGSHYADGEDMEPTADELDARDRAASDDLEDTKDDEDFIDAYEEAKYWMEPEEEEAANNDDSDSDFFGDVFGNDDDYDDDFFSGDDFDDDSF